MTLGNLCVKGRFGFEHVQALADRVAPAGEESPATGRLTNSYRRSARPTRVPATVNGESQVVEARSLVDSAEQALRNWLAGGRYRQGDRLPPEHEVAAMLGVSRGTLRSSLQRLEESGEIVRRQGSGTFVGRMAVPSALDERLERLEPYSSLAARRGLTLTCHDLQHRPSRSRRARSGRRSDSRRSHRRRRSRGPSSPTTRRSR